ncbi:GNAT family N-acetyltransferase [Lacihabitans soyangensis]|uniref:GNAT family N-acetyltransferase n=1 Tax=Lacihabitans soyangensis TaxID=869394 RepID=A0AAE3KUI8_9BACT|nr:GNAT family N-acetyltransferase [Lacihabitans soyangensis]MCP9763251.1 GNAT family N-acetyltransferase [Lacihabitans soyangensis]
MENKLNFRLALNDDLLDIIKMLSDDTLGSKREQFDEKISEKYKMAFENIIKDPNQELTVVEMNGQKVGTFQLTFIQYLTHQGGLRAQVEAVRTHSDFRGQGIGGQMFEYIKTHAIEKGCNMVQLTTDKQRPEALRFYESLGYVASHEGMKLKLV